MSRNTGRAASAALPKQNAITPAESDEWATDVIATLSAAQTPEQAEQLLRRVTTVEEAIRLARLGEERERQWCGLRLKAERRYGELLGPAEPKNRHHPSVTARNARSGDERVAQNRARKVAAVQQQKFDNYIKTNAKPSRAGLLRATAESKQRRPKQKTEDGAALWTDERVLAWVRKLMKAGLARDEITGASRTGARGWPIEGKHLPQNAADRAIAIIKDRDQNGRKKPRESGKRLRQLGIERKADPGRLVNVRYQIVQMVGTLEQIDLAENGIGDADGDTVASVHEELSLLARWLDSSLAVVVAHLDDERALERIRKLREDTSGRTASEIETGQRLAKKLERKRDAKLAA